MIALIICNYIFIYEIFVYDTDVQDTELCKACLIGFQLKDSKTAPKGIFTIDVKIPL